MPGSNPERSCGLLEDKARNDITSSSIETTLGLALSGFAGTLFIHYFIRGEVSASVMTGLGLSLGLFLNQNTSQLAAGMNGSQKNFPGGILRSLLRSSSFTTAAGVGRLVTSHAQLSGIVTAKFVLRFLSEKERLERDEGGNLAP